jgi:hypothetical protein
VPRAPTIPQLFVCQGRFHQKLGRAAFGYALMDLSKRWEAVTLQ